MTKKFYSMVVALFAMMLCSMTAAAQTTIKFDHLTIKAGQTVDVDLLLDNKYNEVQSLEYSFKLPKGLTATKIVRNNDRLDRDEHEATLDLQSEKKDETGKVVLSRTYKISVFSKNGENIIGNEGAICTVTFEADNTFSGEQLYIECVDYKVSDPDGKNIWTSTPSLLINDILAKVTAEPTALSFTKNATATVKVAVESNMEVYGLNATVVLPEGLSFVTKKNGKVDFKYSERMGDNLSIVQNLKEDGSLSIVINGDEALVGLEGEVFSFDVTADVEVLAENSEILINNIAASNFATNTNTSDDIKIAVTNASIAITNAAQADMEWYENLCAELTAAIAGNEEYITPDANQFIADFMGEYYPSAIQAALEDALENGTEYVCPFDKEMVEGQVRSWIAEIEGIKNGTVALYSEAGVVGDATLNSNMPFFATQVGVDVYATDKVVIKGWDGTEGSDLTIYYSKVSVLDEEGEEGGEPGTGDGTENDVRVSITGIEQTVNGEVVSEFIEDEENPELSYVSLVPAEGSAYVAAVVYPFNEMTSILVGQGDETGLGQVSLYGNWMKAPEAVEGEDGEEVVDPGFGFGAQNTVDAAYIVTWPGQEIVNGIVWNNIKAQIANVQEAIDNFDTIVATMMYASRYEGEEITGAVDAARAWVAATTAEYEAKAEARELTFEDGVMGEMMEQMMAVNEAINAAAQYDINAYGTALTNYWIGDDDEFVGVMNDILAKIKACESEEKQEELMAKVEEIVVAYVCFTGDVEAYTQYNAENHAALIAQYDAVMSLIEALRTEVEDAGATGINNATANAVSTGASYDLAGKKVSSNFKGIVIKNNKKVLIK